MTAQKTADPNELGAFLKARRSELSPRDVGLPNGLTLRRVPGLRREEVAQLAAISNDYYTRLEQGRISASAPVLEALARVLQLGSDQHAYLYQLAGQSSARRPRRRPAQKARPYMERILDHLSDTPAMIATPTMDILAWNRLAAALMIDFGEVPNGNGTSSGSSSPIRGCAPCIPSGRTSPARPPPTSGWRPPISAKTPA
ncbi:MAG: helix-turn-helix domain-containing protein [Solirubrobacterales bacterium]|nr:helix-turn-helix domain-containing protein [Solirubrobacterales bacterium]